MTFAALRCSPACGTGGAGPAAVFARDESNADTYSNTIDRALQTRILQVVTTLPFLVGHKEDLKSEVWGFRNSQYNDLITKSGEKLTALAAAFEEKQKSG